jgi:hypothetical protein
VRLAGAVPNVPVGIEGNWGRVLTNTDTEAATAQNPPKPPLNFAPFLTDPFLAQRIGVRDLIQQRLVFR